MSTVAEHLAMIEMLRLAELHDAAHMESFLLTNVHWQDLVAMIPGAEMAAAREQTEQRLRQQHPDAADVRIAAWREKRPKSATSPPAAPTEHPDTKRLDWLEKRSHRGAGDGMNPRAVRLDFFHAWPGMPATTLPLPNLREAIDAALAQPPQPETGERA